VIGLTRDAPHFHPVVRSWGAYFAFASSRDLTHTGNVTQQIFIFKHLNYVCQKGTPDATTLATCPNPPEPYLVQVTDGPGSPDNPSSSDVATDGTQWVAFDALGTFGGAPGEAANHRQIFLKNLKTQELRQITSGIDGESVRPSGSSLGGVIVFESTAALTGQPTGGVAQLFLYDRRTRFLTQLTSGRAPSTGAMMNQNGTLAAFQSSADLLGDGHDTGVSQIFWVEYDKTQLTTQVHQLTAGNGPSEHPYISEQQQVVMFASRATDLSDAPGGGGQEIYASTAIDTSPITLRRLESSTDFGDCDWPALAPSGDRVAFVCTGDPLRNQTTGNRVFALDLPSSTLYQLTGTGDVRGPIGQSLGQWFVTLASTSDLAGQGACGYQLNIIDYFTGHWNAATQPGQLPPDIQPPPGTTRTNLIGKHTFLVRAGNPSGGSSASVTTRDGSTTVPLAGIGGLRLDIGAPDEFTHQAAISVGMDQASFPPVPIGSFGTLCIVPSADGAGQIDCDGGDVGGDLAVSQDHNVDDDNPLCLGGCREGAACQGSQLPGPHQTPCPACLQGHCTSGLNKGQACAATSSCLPSDQCVNGTLGVCNGPVRGQSTGVFAAGGMQIIVPVTINVSTDPWLDGHVCSADDKYAVKGVAATLRLTSGTAVGTIADADDVPAATFNTTVAGAPFSCAALQRGSFVGSRLAGVVPLLDVPEVPGLRDVLLGLSLEPKPDDPACFQPCATNADCDDGNVCNGVETCDPTTKTCVPGTPCNDGNPCNGVEICDQLNGCQHTAPPSCDDNNACTDDRCDTTLGCLHLVNAECGDGTGGTPPPGGVHEICGNCIDDDGNGLTDFEDPACCPPAASFVLNVKRGVFRPRTNTLTRFKIKSYVAETSMQSVNPMKDDVFVQIRPPGGSDLLCAKLPASHFMKMHKAFKFWDVKHEVTTAKGIRDMSIKTRRDGTVRIKSVGKKLQMKTKTGGHLDVVIGFHDPTADASNRCTATVEALTVGPALHPRAVRSAP